MMHNCQVSRMRNDQLHIKSEIYNVCGHATRQMLFQETTMIIKDIFYVFQNEIWEQIPSI